MPSPRSKKSKKPEPPSGLSAKCKALLRSGAESVFGDLSGVGFKHLLLQAVNLGEKRCFDWIELFSIFSDLRNLLTSFPLSLPPSLSLSLPPLSTPTRPHHHVGPDDMEVPDPLYGIRVAGESFHLSFLKGDGAARKKKPDARNSPRLSFFLAL